MVNYERLVKLRSDLEELGLTLRFVAEYFNVNQSEIRRAYLGLRRNKELINNIASFIVLITNHKSVIDKIVLEFKRPQRVFLPEFIAQKKRVPFEVAKVAAFLLNK